MTAKLSEVKSRFTSATPKIKDLLYEELVTRGYFPRSPEKDTSRAGGPVGMVFLIVAHPHRLLRRRVLTDIAPVVGSSSWCSSRWRLV